MKNCRILMPVRTVADWGGVHEWTIDAARSLLAEGHEVTFVGAGELFKGRALATGANFIDVDWDNWTPTADEIVENADYDLIFAHAPEARALGLYLKQKLGTKIFVMIHGAYHDYMYRWSDNVDGFLAASPSLVHFVQRFGRVEPWKVVNIPNAASDSVFQIPIRRLSDKTNGGVARIVTAGRLSKDKESQIGIVSEALENLTKVRPDLHWQVDIYGDGPRREHFDSEYKRLSKSMRSVTYQFHGWVEPDQIPGIMNNAVLAVSAGMAAVRTIAAGALCIGAGARNYVGLQYGRNLQAGIWSNFGDHGIYRFKPTSLGEDIEWVFRDDKTYDEAVTNSRRVLSRTHKQSLVNAKMQGALGI